MTTIVIKNSSTASSIPATGDLVKGELAVNVTDKKVYTKDNSSTVVKLVGSLGNQEANAVAVTGGTITGITDLAIADGGTGQSTATAAFNALAPSQTGNSNKYLKSDGTNTSWNAISLSAADITGTVAVANGGTGVTTSTGTGSVVLSSSPTLVTPSLGTPSTLVGTNITGTASSLTAGTVTTNANLTGVITSTGNATSLGSFTSAQLSAALTDKTGSGVGVFATSPILVTPTLGTPTSATLTNATGLPLSTGVTGTLPIANGGTAATTTAGARTSILPSYTGNAGKVLTVNTGATDAEWITSSGVGTVTSVAALTLGTTGTDLTSSVANSTTTPVITLNVPTASASNRGALSSADWTTFNNKGSGTVTAVSVVSSNGFTGTSSGGATPALTLTTSITGVLKGNGTALSAATAGTDYLAPPSGTALLKANSGGALANATAGTDYVAPGGSLGTPTSGTLSNCTVDGTNEVGYKNIPQNSQGAAYTLVLSDAGKHILHPSADANPRTYTIPANSSVAYPIGTAITFINMTSQIVTLAITTDTMYLSSAGTTGSRSLAQYGSATALKITATSWIISGSGLT